MPGQVQRLEVDGVPVFWRPGPEPLAAGLCFGVGRRDEDFASGGLTHLVEHLVLGELPRSPLDRNASVDASVTEFTATGRPEAVGAFLREVCRLLADLPTGRLAVEVKVLAAEEAQSGSDLFGALLVTRYGATGVGLMGMRHPRLQDLSAGEVRAHAARWFVRERAALWLTGPPPEGLSLPLPSGTAAPRPAQRRVRLPLPAVLRYPVADVALSWEGDEHGEALRAGLRVLRERCERELRHDGGHSYDVDLETTSIEGTACHAALIADAAPAQVPVVARRLYEAFGQLAADGPTAVELAEDLDWCREHTEDPRSVQGAVAEAARAHLAGSPVRDDRARLERVAALRPQDVARALQAALPSLLLLVPEDAPDLEGVPLPDLPEGNDVQVSGREHKPRLFSGAPRGTRLVSGQEGTSLRRGDGGSLTVRYDDCVAVGVDPDDPSRLELVGADGLTLALRAGDWKDGDTALELARRATADLPRYAIAADPQD